MNCRKDIYFLFYTFFFDTLCCIIYRYDWNGFMHMLKASCGKKFTILLTYKAVNIEHYIDKSIYYTIWFYERWADQKDTGSEVGTVEN